MVCISAHAFPFSGQRLVEAIRERFASGTGSADGRYVKLRIAATMCSGKLCEAPMPISGLAFAGAMRFFT